MPSSNTHYKVTNIVQSKRNSTQRERNYHSEHILPITDTIPMTHK